MYDTNTRIKSKIFKLIFMQKKTIVLGASDNVERYSNMAVRKLVAHKHPVIAIGRRKSVIENTPIIEEFLPVDAVDTITLYLNENNQKKFYKNILATKPARIIFNPGAENAELAALATSQGIEVLEACTLVLLSTNQY
jgi:uncharacterized protein